MKRLFIAAAIVLLISGNAYAQTGTGSAQASANQTQNQTQNSFPTAAAGASAGASASQGQVQYSSGGSVANSGNSAIGINNSFNGAAPIRGLPYAAPMPLENYQPGLFGMPNYQDHGPDFISMRQLVAALNLVDLTQQVEGEKSIHITAQMMNTMAPAKEPKKTGKEKSSKELRDKKEAPVVFEINDGEAVNHGFMPIAVLSVATEKPSKSNSASLAMAIGKKAKALGAKRVIFLTEGSSKELTSWGVGIGFSYSYAKVDSDPSGGGGVGAGGTGWSMGKGAYDSLIYLTAIVGN